MQKLVTASLILVFLALVQTTAFAGNLDCKFTGSRVTGVKTIELTNENLILNKEIEIPLEKTRVNCGHFGRQIRFDGNALGYQVILKSCTTDAKLEGHLIDSLNEVAAELHCHSKTTASVQ